MAYFLTIRAVVYNKTNKNSLLSPIINFTDFFISLKDINFLSS